MTRLLLQLLQPGVVTSTNQIVYLAGLHTSQDPGRIWYVSVGNVVAGRAASQDS